MIKIDVQEIHFNEDSFCLEYDAQCDRCGKISSATTRMTRVSRLIIGCEDCESYPSFTADILSFIIETVTSWQYEPLDIETVRNKLLAYDEID